MIERLPLLGAQVGASAPLSYAAESTGPRVRKSECAFSARARWELRPWPCPSHVYEDRWGEIVDRPDSGVIEIRWYDTTRDMTKDEFQQWLATFAGHVEQLLRPGALVDGTSFQMNPAYMDAQWRDANIVPRYNGAGLEKFVFHMPPGMPLIGMPPAVAGPAEYPTGYFGTRREALDWLTE